MRPRAAARGAHEHIERLLLVQVADRAAIRVRDWSSKNAKCRSYSAMSSAHPHSSASSRRAGRGLAELSVAMSCTSVLITPANSIAGAARTRRARDKRKHVSSIEMWRSVGNLEHSRVHELRRDLDGVRRHWVLGVAPSPAAVPISVADKPPIAALTTTSALRRCRVVSRPSTRPCACASSASMAATATGGSLPVVAACPRTHASLHARRPPRRRSLCTVVAERLRHPRFDGAGGVDDEHASEQHAAMAGRGVQCALSSSAIVHELSARLQTMRWRPGRARPRGARGSSRRGVKVEHRRRVRASGPPPRATLQTSPAPRRP